MIQERIIACLLVKSFISGSRGRGIDSQVSVTALLQDHHDKDQQAGQWIPPFSTVSSDPIPSGISHHIPPFVKRQASREELVRTGIQKRYHFNSRENLFKN